MILYIVAFRYITEFDIINRLHLLKHFPLIIRGDHHCCHKNKTSLHSSQLTEFFLQYHGNFEE